MKKGFKRLLLLFPILALSYAAGLALAYFMTQDGQPFNFEALTSSSYTILPVVICGGAYIVYLLNKFADGKTEDKSQLGAKTKEGKDISQYFDSRWVTEKELRTEKRFMYCTWNNIHNSPDGILLRSYLERNNLHINMYSPIHTLIIGATSSGKTQQYIDPTIQIMSSTKTKPSFVITDPKAELYQHHYNKLKKEGYEIKVFDLRQPFGSTKWNPLDNAYQLYNKAINLEKEIKTYVGVNPADLNLEIIANEYNNEWYELDGVAYPNKEILDTDVKSKKAQLIDLAENDLREISRILCPITAKTEQTWERGAQEFIYGTLLAMLEDSADERLGMTRERYNFYNLSKIANYKDNNPDNPFETLKKYFLGRSPYSKALPLVSGAINNAPGATKSYMGIVTSALSTFNDSGMCFATSENEMNFESFADKPTALFIIIPDEKDSRHGIATMMVSQLYSRLVDLANKYKNGKLPRAVYFLLDEFANLPKIEKIDTMITVSRSRNIYFSLVIQSYSQLSSKYGNEVAETIIGNCLISIFIGTPDAKTREEFSKLCGDITLEVTSTSESKQKDANGKDTPNKSKSVSTVSRPLIYPDELGHLNVKDGTGEFIIKIQNEFPMRVKTTRYFRVPMFDHNDTHTGYVPSRSLNEAEILYSIVNRNRIVLGNRPTFTPIDF